MKTAAITAPGTKSTLSDFLLLPPDPLYTSLQNMADSTDAVGWSPILPSVKSVGVGQRLGKA